MAPWTAASPAALEPDAGDGRRRRRPGATGPAAGTGGGGGGRLVGRGVGLGGRRAPAADRAGDLGGLRRLGGRRLAARRVVAAAAAAAAAAAWAAACWASSWAREPLTWASVAWDSEAAALAWAADWLAAVAWADWVCSSVWSLDRVAASSRWPLWTRATSDGQVADAQVLVEGPGLVRSRSGRRTGGRWPPTRCRRCRSGRTSRRRTVLAASSRACSARSGRRRRRPAPSWWRRAAPRHGRTPRRRRRGPPAAGRSGSRVRRPGLRRR